MKNVATIVFSIVAMVSLLNGCGSSKDSSSQSSQTKSAPQTQTSTQTPAAQPVTPITHCGGIAAIKCAPGFLCIGAGPTDRMGRCEGFAALPRFECPEGALPVNGQCAKPDPKITE